MKKLFALVTATIMAASIFSGCTAKNEGASENADGKKTVGIIQYASHPSLDNCRNGIEEALKEAFGDEISIDVQNGNADVSACDSIAKNMAAKNYDVIVPIATPAALSAYAAAKDKNIPVVFCAVSDPVEAGLARSQSEPEKNCTGTSDVLNLKAQLELICTMQPNVKKIGVLYTTSEANSVSHLKTLTEIANERNIEIVSQGVQGAADIPQAAASLCAKVDCINNFTDNNVVNNLSVLLQQAGINNIPVYGSEVEQVTNGCIAAESIDYVALGKKTGEMVGEILNGKDISEISIASIEETEPVINETAAAALGIEIPDKYRAARLVSSK